MADFREWQWAFVRQVKADWAAYQQLTLCDLPSCQALHFLQMACEKLVKAHLFAGKAVPDPPPLRTLCAANIFHASSRNITADQSGILSNTIKCNDFVSYPGKSICSVPLSMIPLGPPSIVNILGKALMIASSHLLIMSFRIFRINCSSGGRSC